MRVIRVKHEAHYTMIRNKTLRDSRLSFKARGLLTYLLSLPDQTTVNREDLSKFGTEGEYAVRTALQELVKFGYIEHERVRGERGTWLTDTVVRECPSAEGRLSTSGPRLSTVGDPPWITALCSSKDLKDERPVGEPPLTSSAARPERPHCDACREPAYLAVEGANLCLDCYERPVVITPTNDPAMEAANQ